MGFLESIKLKAKEKAHYKCCICNSFKFIEVHHIIPQEENGSDTLDNAAPLCVECHDTFGSNPEKRKWIKEKRDFWYKLCEEKLFNEDINQLRKVQDIMENIQQESNNHKTKIRNIESDMVVLKNTVTDLANKNNLLAKSLSSATPKEIPIILSQIQNTSLSVSGAAIVMTKLGEVYSNGSVFY